MRLHLPPAAILSPDDWIPYAHTGRFCEIAAPDVRHAVESAWQAAVTGEHERPFEIDARPTTLRELIARHDCRLYLIPVFQRPYAWSDRELERFLGDLLASYPDFRCFRVYFM